MNQSSVIYVTTYLTTTEQGFYKDDVESTFLDRMMTFLVKRINYYLIIYKRESHLTILES